MSDDTTTETSDWKLNCFLRWRPKYHDETCKRCCGAGRIGGGFKDIEGERDCPDCHGRGSVSKPPTTPEPELPAALVEHMRRAWWDFQNKQEAKQ